MEQNLSTFHETKIWINQETPANHVRDVKLGKEVFHKSIEWLEQTLAS